MSDYKIMKILRKGNVKYIVKRDSDGYEQYIPANHTAKRCAANFRKRCRNAWKRRTEKGIIKDIPLIEHAYHVEENIGADYGV